MKGTLRRKFSRVVVILIMLWKACDTLLTFDSDGYNSNHNYGYLFKRVGEVYLSTGEAKVLFHYRLPDPINKTTMGSVNCRLMVDRHLHYASTRHLIEMVASIKDRTMTHLSSTIKHIYDVTTDWKESPRNKRSWWSSGWRSFTDLAQKTDLERLTHYLQKIETGVCHAVESWQSGSSNFITALEAEKKRVDNIDKLLASQRESILTLQEEIVQQYHEQVGFSRLMTNLITDYLVPMFLTTTDATLHAKLDKMMQSIEDSKTATALVRQGGSPKPKRVSFGDFPSGQQNFSGERNFRQPNMTSGQTGQFTQPFYPRFQNSYSYPARFNGPPNYGNYQFRPRTPNTQPRQWGSIGPPSATPQQPRSCSKCGLEPHQNINFCPAINLMPFIYTFGTTVSNTP